MAGLVAGSLVLSGTFALNTLSASRASAAVLGQITITVPAGGQSGTDATAFGGTVTSNCPAGTLDTNFFIDDVDDPSGSDLPRQQAFLGPGLNGGVGPQEFSNIAIANLKTNNTGSFSQSGPYKIRFECQASGGVAGVTDTYEAILDYVAGGAGSFTFRAPAPSPPSVLVSPSQTVGPSAVPSSTKDLQAPLSVASSSPTDSIPGEGPRRGDATGSGEGGLARTGSTTGPMVAASVALLGAGIALAVLCRRRRWFGRGAHQGP